MFLSGLNNHILEFAQVRINDGLIDGLDWYSHLRLEHLYYKVKPAIFVPCSYRVNKPCQESPPLVAIGRDMSSCKKNNMKILPKPQPNGINTLDG